MPRRADRGSILPLSILLVVMLTISGMAFLQLDFLERRMTMNEADNQGAFYLATASLERARAALKIPMTTRSWTALLRENSDPAHQFTCAGRPMCEDLSRGCAILPSLSDPVRSPEIPFSGTFTQTEYRVRAYNNLNDPDPGASTTDTDRRLTLRACGTVRGEQKLLEATIKPVSGRIVNCNEEVQGSSPCPEDGGVSPWGSVLEDHLSASFPASALPSLPPIAILNPSNPAGRICNLDNYYCNQNNFPPPSEGWGYAQFFDRPVVTKDAIDDDVQGSPKVIVSGGDVKIVGPWVGSAIIVAQGNVTLDSDIENGNPGQITVTAPSPSYPAIIAGGSVFVTGPAMVTGTIYAKGGVRLEGPTVYQGGNVMVGPVRVEGAVYGLGLVSTMSTGGTVTITDNGDNGTLDTYDLMWGFTYPDGSVTNAMVPNTWREIQ